MCNFRYVLAIPGLPKNILLGVKFKDITLTFLITAPKTVSQGNLPFR